MAQRKYRIVIAREARDELRKQLNYIRKKWSTKRAIIVNDGINDEIKKLDSFPYRHPTLHRISDEERTYRFVPKWSYLIIFRIEEAIRRIRVVSIFSSDQDPDKIDDIKGR